MSNGPSRIAVLGLGEAGAVIARGLRERGADVVAYDPRAAGLKLQEVARAADVRLAESAVAAVAAADVVLVLTAGTVALDVATSIAPALRADVVYADWTSTSPQAKTSVAAVVAPYTTLVVDGAIMAAVPQHGAAVPVVLSGPGADEFVARTTGLGLSTTVIGPDIGQASAAKMLRSLLVKGIEALVLECLLGARVYGVTDTVLASMAGTPDTADWVKLAAYVRQRVDQHGPRRADELAAVSSTLFAAGVTPLLASAAAARMWSHEEDEVGSP